MLKRLKYNGFSASRNSQKSFTSRNDQHIDKYKVLSDVCATPAAIDDFSHCVTDAGPESDKTVSHGGPPSTASRMPPTASRMPSYTPTASRMPALGPTKLFLTAATSPTIYKYMGLSTCCITSEQCGNLCSSKQL